MTPKTPLENFLYRLGWAVAVRAKKRSPFKTGNLRRDIQAFTQWLKKGFVEVGNTKITPYAWFVHEGTGIFGPNKKRIKPKQKKALKTPYGVKKSITGMPARPYLEEAAKEVIEGKELNQIASAFTNELGDSLIKDFKI